MLVIVNNKQHTTIVQLHTPTTATVTIAHYLTMNASCYHYNVWSVLQHLHIDANSLLSLNALTQFKHLVLLKSALHC